MKHITEIFTRANEYAKFNALELAIKEHNQIERVVSQLITERKGR